MSASIPIHLTGSLLFLLHAIPHSQNSTSSQQFVPQKLMNVRVCIEKEINKSQQKAKKVFSEASRAVVAKSITTRYIICTQFYV